MSWKEKERLSNSAGYPSKNQIDKLNVIRSVILNQSMLDQSPDDFRLTYEQFEARYLGSFIPDVNRYQGKTVRQIVEKIPLATMVFDLKFARGECHERYMDIICEAMNNRKPGVNLVTLKQIEFVPRYHRQVKSYCRFLHIDI